MELNHTDDVSTQTAKMIAVANQITLLTEQLKIAGNTLNNFKIECLRAKTPRDKEEAKIKRQEAEGKFAEIKADIKVKKEIINVLKMVIRAENNQTGGF